MITKNLKTLRTNRKAAVLVLMAFLLPVVLIVCFFSIDVAWMLLLRTELRVATDVAARAAASTYSRTGDEGSADTAGQNAALLNRVGGQGLVLTPAQIEIGESSRSSQTGRFQFSTQGSIRNSVRVTATAPRPLFASGLFGITHFTPQQIATASFRYVDVCLVLDRSSSMKLGTNESGGGLPASDPRTCEPPEPTSRWIALENAVNAFADVLEHGSGAVHVGIVTYGSDYTMPCEEDTTLPASRLDCSLTENLNLVRNTMSNLSAEVWGGMTETHSGIDRATQLLTNSNATRQTAQKVMIVFTDGHYTGNDPVPYATTAYSQDVIVHAVTFGSGANQTEMQNVATAGGGDHYHAPDAATLDQIFRRLAASPMMLTE